MQTITYQTDLKQVQAYLYALIKEHAASDSLAWLDKQMQKLQQEWSYRTFYFSFSSVPRFMGKANISYTEEDINKANALREGFSPQDWDMTQLSRTYILLFLPHEKAEDYALIIDQMCETADMYEQQALYAALPLLPHPQALTDRTSEGIRTNMTNVFDAIALHNPYPSAYLGQEAWNQLLLKAVFMGRPLYKIYHAEERANPELARMLMDFAHERWAAHRQISPEIWRFVAPYLSEEYLLELEKSIKDGQPLEAEAALLACSENTYTGGRMLLDQHPATKEHIQKGDISWKSIGERYLTSE